MAGAVCVLAAGGATAATASSGSLKVSMAPDRLGASTALTVASVFSGGNAGIPEPLTHEVLHLPAGLRVDVKGVGVCPAATLQAQAGRGCPASSRVGRGSSLSGAHLGAINLSESAGLSAWRGPNRGGRPVLEILGEGLSPLEERVVVIGVLEADRPPYSQRLTLSIPPIPTLPTEPNASLLHTSVTVGAGRGALAHLIHAPHSCPAGGFPFAADFTYADGSTSSASARVRCP